MASSTKTFYVEEILSDDEGPGSASPDTVNECNTPQVTDESSPSKGGGTESGQQRKTKNHNRNRKKRKAKANKTPGGGSPPWVWSCEALDHQDEGGGNKPCGRGGASIVSVGPKILVFGGADRVPMHYGDLHCFDTRTHTWSIVKGGAPGPCPRSGHTAVTMCNGRYMVVFGGINFMDETVFSDVHVFNTEVMSWVPVEAEGIAPCARNSHTATALSGNRMVVFGGSSPEDGPLHDLHLLTLEEKQDLAVVVTWKKVEVDERGPKPSPREMHSACRLALGGDGTCEQEVILVFGGRQIDGAVCSDMWKLDTREWTWTRKGDGPAPRCSHVAFELNGKMGILAGFDGVATIYTHPLIYDLDKDHWDSHGCMDPGLKERFGLAACGGGQISEDHKEEQQVWLFGGVNLLEDLSDLLVLRPAMDGVTLPLDHD